MEQRYGLRNREIGVRNPIAEAWGLSSRFGSDVYLFLSFEEAGTFTSLTRLSPARGYDIGKRCRSDVGVRGQPQPLELLS